MTRRTVHVVLAVALTLLVTGCGGAQIHTGLLELDERQRVQLGTSDGAISLVGSLEDELAKIVHAQVKVWGTGSDRSVRVEAYQILDIGNGFDAYVGWIVLDQRGARLLEWSTGREWTLVVPSLKEFRAMHGAKIWLTGFQNGPDELRPMQWGILQPAP